MPFLPLVAHTPAASRKSTRATPSSASVSRVLARGLRDAKAMPAVKRTNTRRHTSSLRHRTHKTDETRSREPTRPSLPLPPSLPSPPPRDILSLGGLCCAKVSGARLGWTGGEVVMVVAVGDGAGMRKVTVGIRKGWWIRVMVSGGDGELAMVIGGDGEWL